MFTSDRDTEQFRDTIARELEQAREIAATQSGSLDAFRVYLTSAVERFHGHCPIEHIRDAARDHKERADRAKRNLTG